LLTQNGKPQTANSPYLCHALRILPPVVGETSEVLNMKFGSACNCPIFKNYPD
jgi:hypothetical protein